MNPGTDWIDQARRLLDTLRPSDVPADGTAESHPSDCRWCPVCQVAAVLRGERPEVTAALADVLTATATALRTFAGEEATAAAPKPEAAEPEEPVPAPVVQRIDIA